MSRTVLLNPGLVNVTDRVRQALMLPDLCHREKEFTDLMAAIRAKLLKAFNIEEEYTSVLVSGSGTAALEMAVSSSLSPGRSMLVIQNGVYGERIGKICDIYQFNRHTIKLSWGEPPNLEDIEKELKENPDIEVVALVHHETTTGLLNPLKEVGELARRYEKIYLVDCISSLAGDEIDFKSIDIAVGTANKCIQGFPAARSDMDVKEQCRRTLRNRGYPACWGSPPKGLGDPKVWVTFAPPPQPQTFGGDPPKTQTFGGGDPPYLLHT